MHATEPQQSSLPDHETVERTGVVVELNPQARLRERREEQSLRCVSSGYLAGGCSCQSSVPAPLARAAWASELELEGNDEDRLFHFAWRGEVWLAFGLAGGEIRGVYCPTHRAAREAHAVGRRPRSMTSGAAVAVGA
ncbi:MAG TPA: hypothetical protein VGD00_06320 [Solirubrobacteraceae bacterium]